MNYINILGVALLSCVVYGKVTITKFDLCEPGKEYPIKWTHKLGTDANGMQVIEEGELINKIPLGDNVLQTIEVFTKENGEYKFLVNVEETYCQAAKKFMGEFALEMQKASGLEPGTCPIPPGTYNIKNYMLDFSKFKYKNVPKGDIKVKAQLLDAKSKELLSCVDLEFTLV